MIKSNFHTGHLPQATICPKHKNFPSWNLLKRPPLVRTTRPVVSDLYGRSIHTTTLLRVCEKI